MTTASILNFSHHRGGNRAVALFTLDNGEPIKRRINGEADEAASLAKAVAKIPDIELSIQERDAERADDANADIAAAGMATKKQVAIRRVKSFVKEPDPVIALKKIRKIIAFITSEGWTAAQVKAQLEIPDSKWTRIVAKRNYLLANETTIDASEVVQNGVPE